MTWGQKPQSADHVRVDRDTRTHSCGPADRHGHSRPPGNRHMERFSETWTRGISGSPSNSDRMRLTTISNVRTSVLGGLQRAKLFYERETG